MQNTTSKDYNTKDNHGNKYICAAIGCSKNTTKKLALSVGIFGQITIPICDNCRYKFE